MEKFSIVSVNYNNYSLTKKVVDKTIHVLKEIDYEIIIVDNGSENNSFHILNNHYIHNNKVKIINSKKNGGFGYGCNIGCKYVKNEIIWFLNSDAWIDSIEGFNEMFELVLKNDTGIIGTAVMLNNGTATPQGGSDMSFIYFLFSSLRLGKLFRNLPTPLYKNLIKIFDIMPGIFSNYSKSLTHDKKKEKIQTIGVGGASFIIRKNVFLKNNGFDEKFFLYDEDGDLCLRLHKNGYQNYIFPIVKVMTYPSATTSKLDKVELKRIKKNSRLYFIDKHFYGIKKFALILITTLTWRLL